MFLLSLKIVSPGSLHIFDYKCGEKVWLYNFEIDFLFHESKLLTSTVYYALKGKTSMKIFDSHSSKICFIQ